MMNKLFYLTLAVVATTGMAQAQQASNVAPDYGTYAMIMSYGNLPNDKDVMVVRHEGSLYSFKYCKAYTPEPAQDIVQIRKKLFLNSKNPEYGSESQGMLKALFQSPSCQLMGNQAYGVPNEDFAGSLEARGHGPLVEYLTLATGISGLTTIPSMLQTSHLAKYYWSRQNTETAFKFFLSSRFPRGWASIATVLLGATTGLGYWTYQVRSENAVKDRAAEDEHNAKELIAQSVRENIVVVGSMADFHRDFEKSFKTALEKHWFVEL